MRFGSRVGIAARLWALGVWESLQLHRCIVLFVLDNSQGLWTRVWHCLFLNGCLFLGCVAWRALVLRPATHWLMTTLVEPCWGHAWAHRTDEALGMAFNYLLLLPLYATTMLASSIEYQSIAKAAYVVQQEKQQRAQGAADAMPREPYPRLSHSQSSGSSMQAVAQDVYRVLLLSVYYLEVWLLGNIPYAGKVLYLVLMTWLWAYYCYDYKWSIQGIPLADRIAYFETHWAFFSGFGMLMSASTVLMPFYWGAASSAILFPLFIIVACDSNPDKAHALLQFKFKSEERSAATCRQDTGSKSDMSQSPASLGQIPIFYLALWPCQQLFGLIGMR